MKALVLKAHNQLVHEDFPDPKPGPRDVLIRVKACGICGSDVHGIDGSTGRRIPPIVMGHEAAGVVAETGPEVHGWQPGDRVTFDSTIYCGECHFCHQGAINLCDRRRVLGVSCGEYRRHGAFAEYVAVPQHILYRLPDAVSFEMGAMVEPVSIAVHGVGRAPVGLGRSAVVVGCGMIGLLAVQALRVSGCGCIVAVDVDESKLVLASRFGADAALHPERDDVLEAVLGATDGRGADVAVEAVGIDATQKLAVRSARKGGSVVLIGNRAPTAELLFQHIVTREITVYGSCASAGEYRSCLDMIARRAIDVEPLMSAVAPLAEGAQWFERLYQAQEPLMKVVLVT